MVRFLERCPPSHVLVHSAQSDQEPTAQSTFSPKPHAWMMSAKPGALACARRSSGLLQERTSRKAAAASLPSPLPSPTQYLPAPLPGTEILRVRDCTPSQLVEQPDHSVHVLSTQSWSPSHGPASQPRTSAARPSALLPHGEASRRTLRWRHWMPLPQDLEQSPQLPQLSHSPSTHSSVSHGSFPQASTSLTLPGDSQALPPQAGCALTLRERLRCPPSHVLVHAPH
mmetsp:Transcript_750/g.2046  ORF Transcript_750/g.2046 Transcript_750/m.2046 type:complete len:227 (+) Transcript_750:2684-3364(+)